MSEQIVQIENINPSDLYGANDQHLTKIKNLFPKLKLIARGDFVKVIGEDDEVNFSLQCPAQPHIIALKNTKKDGML